MSRATEAAERNGWNAALTGVALLVDGMQIKKETKTFLLNQIANMGAAGSQLAGKETGRDYKAIKSHLLIEPPSAPPDHENTATRT